MSLTQSQIANIVRPKAKTFHDAILMHSGVKGMKWSKKKSLEEQGETGDALVNGVAHDTEMLDKINKWIASEKDPKKKKDLEHSKGLYELDLKASKALENFRKWSGSPRQKEYENELNSYSPNIVKAAKKNKYNKDKDASAEL